MNNDICVFAPSSTTLATLFCNTCFFGGDRDGGCDEVFEDYLQRLRGNNKGAFASRLESLDETESEELSGGSARQWARFLDM